MRYAIPVNLGSTVLELSKLHMDKFFYYVLQPSFKDLMLHYMATVSCVSSFTEGNVDKSYMDLSHLDDPIKTNNKVPGKLKHELRSREMEQLIVLKPKTYSFNNNTPKEKGIKKRTMARMKTTIMHYWIIKKQVYKKVGYKKLDIKWHKLKILMKSKQH